MYASCNFCVCCCCCTYYCCNAYEYYSPLAFRASSTGNTVTSVGFSDLSGPNSNTPILTNFRNVEDSVFIHIMSEPVLEKSKSTLSKGTSSAPQTWAEYKERLKVFGWQNGTSYKWYYYNLKKLRKGFVWIPPKGRGIRDILLFSFSSLSRPSVSFIHAKMHAICQGKALECMYLMHSRRAIETGRDREMKVWSIF